MAPVKKATRTNKNLKNLEQKLTNTDENNVDNTNNESGIEFPSTLTASFNELTSFPSFAEEISVASSGQRISSSSYDQQTLPSISNLPSFNPSISISTTELRCG